MSNICDDLRAAILQAAMQGKLTQCNASDDNVEELCNKIVKERSAYKPNKFVEKQNDDITIPDEWRSLKSGEVFELIIGEKVTNGDNLPLLDAKYFRGKQFSKTNKGNLANKGDVLILVDGENSGETFLCTESGYMGSTFKGLFIPKCINRDFALYFLEMNRKILRDNKRGAAIPHLDKKLFFNFIFPIPSLAEQKRIVEKVDELMARVADLEQSADTLTSLKKAFPDDIKASLLQYAMQGKLTKQLPEDGNAEDLLEKIKAEKEKLIAEGKIKKQKPLAPITDDEIPFSIPENWKWVRLRDICTKIADGDHNPPKGLSRESEYLMLSSQNINNDALVNMSKVRYLDKSTFEKVNERTNLQKEDILFTSVGSLGRSCIFRGDINACFQRSISVLTTLIYNEYLKLFLDSPFIQNKVYKEATGTAQKGFYLNQLEKCPIAIPPLAEQKRIVERLKNTIRNINAVGELIASE
ncbi:restriction endonuclease subunit S [Candidatus Saccharibacteria bacterium]|nr:restriction endonuclease subunit S [Candidatus Saccharibacteria bacterium]